ncbi:MAG: hypothetical protein DRG83_14000 [Deltaproteobacteria bacterium]|nr:MAG: hypothetical protein DRG83_14000 [Deltaproteobacteria bacterium]
MNSYTWNRPAEMTLPGGSTKVFEYDPLMRIKRITAKDPGQNIIMDYGYTYDSMNNIVGKVTEHGNYSYGYDDLYRLISVDNPDFSDEAFSYDPVGNRLTSAGITGTWTYNSNNELVGYDGISYQYDANGNTIQKDDNGVITEYSYDIENRLIEVTTDAPQPTTCKYYYDPFGRRLWKEVDGTKTYFMYSNEGLVAELDSGGNVTKSYGYKPNSTWTTDPVFMKVGNDYYFYHNDHLGTPQKLTAISGAVVWSAKYTSFGEAAIDPTSTITNNLRFPGQYYDEETGLHYNWHRYYDPKNGQYLRKDEAIGYGSGLYGYARENPLSYVDSLGLRCKHFFSLPVKFRISKRNEWAKWKSWEYEGFNTYEGGEGPIFWFNARCRCVRRRFGQRILLIEAYVKRFYWCKDSGCEAHIKEEAIWEPLFDFSEEISDSERQEVNGGWVLNDNQAEERCRAKCLELNQY